MSKEENISSLTVEDLLALLNHPQEEIASEVKNLIKDQFSQVTDRWLVNGLLDYFFATNSKHILDLLMGAPELHGKYFLEKICGGIKSSGDQFRHVSLLLYAVSRNPPPIWFYKIPSAVMKDLLDVLSPSRESDINVLISGVIVLVLLLPALPLELTKFLLKIFDCFWRLAHWTPTRQHDSALKPYLQVAVSSLFHRLYALYPINLLGFMRDNTVRRANKSWFLNTLLPMLERVRFHPLLVSETNESELSKSRWVGLEPCDLIHECAKLCFEPLQEICEEMYFSSSKRQSICDSVPEPSEYIILCSSESNFWSPGAVQSPRMIITSLPHSSDYPFQLLGNQSTGMGESPPEAAIEATPESTPFTSPSPFDLPAKHDSRTLSQRFPKLKTSLSEPAPESRFPPPLSPGKRDVPPLRFPSKHSQDILLRSEKSDLLQNMLQGIQRERIEKKKEEVATSTFQGQETLKSSDTSNSNIKISISDSCEITASAQASGRKMGQDLKFQIDSVDAKPKSKVRRFGMCELKGELDPLLLGKELDNEEKLETAAELVRKNSDDSEPANEEGLGVPCRQAMTELIKTVKTNRLRFLSQCGPPPNIALLNDMNSKACASPAKANVISQRTKHKSRSYPNLSSDEFVLSSSIPNREYAISSLSLSPVKSPVKTVEATTQTEELAVDPYEQLLDVLMFSSHNRAKEERENREKDRLSPYQIFDKFIEYCCNDDPSPCRETGWNTPIPNLDNKAKSHLRGMHCLIMLERYKREVHAERNRRLLGKIKKLHLLQERDSGLRREKAALIEEMVDMQRNILKLQEKNKIQEKMIGEMVEKKELLDAQEKQSNASCQRDHLREMCDSLREEKIALIKDLENCQSEVRECQRQLKINFRHSSENATLKAQVEDLNKRIVIMGEVQLEIQQQIKKYRESQCETKLTALASEKAIYTHKIEELEHKFNAEKLSLEAAMYRIGELEAKLNVQLIDKVNHRQELDSTVALWKERCVALEKRNKQLGSINIILESQMTQFQKFISEKEGEEGASARRLVSPRNVNAIIREPDELLPPSSDSYVTRMTSSEFESIGSNPKAYK